MGLARDTVRRYLATPEAQAVAAGAGAGAAVAGAVGRGVVGAHHGEAAHHGPRLHRALREEGYEIGLSLVLEYLREWRRERAEVYVPLVHRPGDEAQVDFFEVTVELAGERRKAWLFLMRLMHSRRDFARLYERQDQLAFLDGHVWAFARRDASPSATHAGSLFSFLAVPLCSTYPRREQPDTPRYPCR